MTQVFWVFLVYIFILEKRKEKKNLEINYNIPLHAENSKIQNPFVEIKILKYIDYSAYGKV